MTEQTNVPAKEPEHRPRAAGPFDLFTELESALSRLWNGGALGSWPFGSAPGALPQPRGSAMPRADVFEQNGNIMVKAELPGVSKDNINLTIEDGDLVLRAERKEESEVNEEQYVRMERQFGSLYRRLPLPAGINPDEIQANLTDGVLEVTIPKPSPAKADNTKHIPVA